MLVLAMGHTTFSLKQTLKLFLHTMSFSSLQAQKYLLCTWDYAFVFLFFFNFCFVFLDDRTLKMARLKRLKGPSHESLLSLDYGACSEDLKV